MFATRYNKLVWMTALAVMIGCGLSLIAIAGCDSPISASPYSPIAQVETDGGQGSGTLIAVDHLRHRGLILSCRHVGQRVGKEVRILFKGHPVRKFLGQVIDVVPGVNFNSDLSLIECDVPDDAKPLVVGKFDKTNGPWRCIGWRHSEMYEAMADDADEHDGYIDFNSKIVPGQSGGAILDRFNRVVGVTVGSEASGAESGVAADGDFLSRLIIQHSK